MNVNTGRVNLVWIEFARLDYDLRFGHSELATGGHVGIEVPRGAPINKIAMQIGLPGFYQRHVGANSAFQNISYPIELLLLFSLGHKSANPCSRIKAGNARTASPQALGERTLRTKLHL